MLRISIKTKLIVIISLLMLSFIAFNVAYYPVREKRNLRAQAILSARQVAETASYAVSPALSSGNQAEIAEVLDGVKHLPAFSFSVVFDDRGNRVDSTPSTPAWVGTFGHNQGVTQAFIRPESGTLVAVAPVFFREPHPDRVGTLVIGFTTEEIQKAAWDNVALGLSMGAVALLLGIVSAIYIANRYIDPVLQLTAAAQQVAQGNLEALSLQVRSRDEIADLSNSFEIMTTKLRVSRNEIERQNRLLEFRVHERTRQLMETIWELEEIRANLEQLVHERTRGLEQSRAELKAWADTLEQKVREKTLELTELNENLIASNQKLLDVDRMKSEFLANMSHELRTPLNAVIGFSGLLLQSQDRLSEDVREDLGIIYQNGRSLLTMIDSILDLSKIEAGSFDLELQEIDPLPLLEELRPLAIALILGRPIAFRYEPPTWHCTVMGDPVRFKQVLTNIVGNAIKFTESGQVAIQAMIEGDLLKITVQDTGIGMAPDDLERLFRPFQQVDGSITRRFGGTGLGLALSQRLMELMGGHITVASEKGKGSCFTLEMPVLSPKGVPEGGPS